MEPKLRRTCFQITEQYADKTNGIKDATSCYKEAVKFSSVFPLQCHCQFLTIFGEQQ